MGVVFHTLLHQVVVNSVITVSLGLLLLSLLKCLSMQQVTGLRRVSMCVHQHKLQICIQCNTHCLILFHEGIQYSNNGKCIACIYTCSCLCCHYISACSWSDCMFDRSCPWPFHTSEHCLTKIQDAHRDSF